MHPKLRFSAPWLSLPLLALFVSLAGTAVAANIVPTRRGTWLATARSEAPPTLERLRQAMLRMLAVRGRAGAFRAVNIVGTGAVPGLQATALAGAGNAGRMVTLRSRVSDDSGRARVLEQVLRNGRVMAALRSSVASASGSTMFATSWRAPANAAGRLQHCVCAIDEAGNTSPRSCAGLTLR